MADPIDPLARLTFLEADNARLRRLLDEAGRPDGLRHSLLDTVAMLRAIMRQSAETASEVGSFVAHLDDRLGAIVRVRATVDAFGEVDLHTIVSDELLAHLVREGERATISGPRLRLRPKAAQVFALAMHELVVNAVEHGALGESRGGVAVAWQAEAEAPEPGIVFVWKECGGSIPGEPARRGFGLVVIEETLAYELGAQTALAFEPDGLRCTIRFTLAGRIGRLTGALAEAEDEEP